MGSCAAPSAKGDDKFITTDYLQQCPASLLNLASELFTAVTAGLAGYGVAVSQEWPEGIIFCVVLIASNNGSEILQGLKSRASNVLNLLSVIANGGKGGEK
ncbi:hypothetical protein DEO61_09265 [Escherichia coli]|nr:hypothetical protein DEO61_09265 [Escherichia coli]